MRFDKTKLAMFCLTCVLPLAVAGAAVVAFDHGLIPGWFLAWVAFGAGLMTWLPRLDEGSPTDPREAHAPVSVGEDR